MASPTIAATSAEVDFDDDDDFTGCLRSEQRYRRDGADGWHGARSGVAGALQAGKSRQEGHGLLLPGALASL